MKHTPGPWRIEIDGELVGPLGGFMPFGGGCYGSPWMTGITEEARKADARLIAAAPDLLEALKMWMKLHESPAGYEGKYGKALTAAIEAQQVRIDAAAAASRAAIAKAEAGNG